MNRWAKRCFAGGGRWGRLVVFGLAAACLPCLSSGARKAPFSVSVGTQTIGVKYRFSEDPALVETAKAIRNLGCDTLKLSVSPKYDRDYGIRRRPDIKTALDLITKEPSYKQVFDMPFRNIMFWLYPFSETWTTFRTGEIPEAETRASYKEIHDLTAYLLKTYSGSGKSFFIGNWEGDWHLTGTYDHSVDASPKAIKGAIAWFKLRQQAVADARRDTPHHNVEVYFYVELNLVKKAMESDRPAIVNKVLPHIETDYVSWSSYDTTIKAAKRGGAEGRRMVFDALDYIERHLPDSDIPGKRVMIGEYGYKLEMVKDPKVQKEHTAAVAKWGLEWGCPFILYWELYCNEINPHNGKHRGYWLIDDRGTRQPVWTLHRDFLKKANAFVDEHQRTHGTLPRQELYNRKAASWIQDVTTYRGDAEPEIK